ncbi:hypothetical protein ACGFNU_39275 [Spirillospora sp. NPDC048911]|uniref:hypothetical protein n=1 Tax=Spirillospora sp. NPDC048911 TaxID=3364527 RepID=UPI0037100D61
MKLLSAAVLLAAGAAACTSPATNPQAPATPQAGGAATGYITARTLPPGRRTLSSVEGDIALDLPAGWRRIDLNATSLSREIKKAGFGGPAMAYIKDNAKGLGRKHALYVADSRDTARSPVNTISGTCDGGEERSISVQMAEVRQQLARRESIVGPVAVSQVAIGDPGGMKADYLDGLTRLVYFRIMYPGRKVCTVTFTARPGSLTPELDSIAKSIRPLPPSTGLDN